MLNFRALRDYFPHGPPLGDADKARIAAWRRVADVDLNLRHGQMRYVVVDTETTGLDLRHDRVIAIGATGLSSARIHLDDCFQAVLRQDKASPMANILIHGIGGQTQLGGVDPRAGALDFMDFIGKSPLVAFRAEFDRTMMERAMRSILGFALHRTWIDLAFLLPALFTTAECRTLDEWLRHFGLAGTARHEAVADAFATAQLLQIALVEAHRQSMETPADLVAMEKAQQWLGKR